MAGHDVRIGEMRKHRIHKRQQMPDMAWRERFVATLGVQAAGLGLRRWLKCAAVRR
jgi:hypothetical protein